jgi:hypothetical protein
VRPYHHSTTKRSPGRIWTVVLIGACLLAGGWAPARHVTQPATDAADSPQRFAILCSDYLDWYFRTHPVRATRLGIHRHDSTLPDVSREGIERRVAESRAWLQRLQTIDPARLDRAAGFDHRILDHAIRAELLELEEIHGWQHNPLIYSRLIADALATLVEDANTPLDQRLPSLVDRMDGIAQVIDAARENLEEVPALWADLAANGVRGTTVYIETDLGRQLHEQGLLQLDSDLRRRWERTRRRTVAQMTGFASWIETDLAASATGDFRLGPDLFERKLRYEEHVVLSADELRTINRDKIEQYQAWLVRVAAQLDPHGSPDVVMTRITQNHPDPDDLLEAGRR